MQFDVYRPDGRSPAPFLLDVQADLLDHLATRIVVPLIEAERFGKLAYRLHIRLRVANTELVLATHLLAAIRRNALGPVVANLASQRDDIIAALDILWAGV